MSFIQVFSVILQPASSSRYVGLVIADYFPMPPPILPRPTTIRPMPQPRPVPLTDIDVRATVRAWAYDVTAKLTYQNKLSQQIECQFVFPIADTAAVYKLEAVMGGRKLKAEVRSRTEAETAYRQAVDAGQSAALLENQANSPDIYRVVLGNLGANETAVVTIAYAMPIERSIDSPAMSITLPVVLNPRYTPESDISDPEIMSQNFQADVPYVAVSAVRYAMNFSANIDVGTRDDARITGIESDNATDILNVKYGTDNKTADVTLTSRFSPDHDFKLNFNVTQALKPTVFVEPKASSSDDAGATSWLSYDIAAAWFEPLVSSSSDPNSRKKPTEYWLIIDRSGSMMGEKINSAKATLALFIKSLPINCFFNIIGFGSNYAALFNGGTVEYSEQNVNQAIEYANRLDADMGGTEILQPLQYIYALAPKDTGNKRCIILLTDGEVSNTNDVIDAARRNSNTTRIFSVGIGDGASTALVNGVARVSNGVSDLVGNSKRNLQSKVVGLLKATTMPSAENVNLSWPITSGKLEMAVPRSLPTAAFRGRAITQYAVISRQAGTVAGTADLSATVEGTARRLQQTFSIPAQSFSDSDDPMPLHRLAAKARLVELTDQYGSSRSDEVKQQAIAISISTGVICQFTALLAVDSDSRVPVNDSTGKPLFVNIERPTTYQMGQPSYVLSGRAGMVGPIGSFGGSTTRIINQGQLGLAGMAWPAAPVMRPAPAPPLRGADSVADSNSLGSLQSMNKGYGATYTTTMLWTSTTTRSRTTMTTTRFVADLDGLMALQSPFGNWTLTADLVRQLVNPSIDTVDELRDAVTDALPDDVTPNDDLTATLVGIAILQARFSTQEDVWGLLRDKAVDHLMQSSTGITTANYKQILSDVSSALNLKRN